MHNYYRVRLGQRGAYAQECVAGDFVGVDYGIHQDLTGKVPENWRSFNSEYIPIYLAAHPGKSRVAAGLACGALWSIARGIHQDDVVLCPDGEGRYHVAEISGEYIYQPEEVLPHRRPVRWKGQAIDIDDMSEALRKSVGSPSTVIGITGYRDEIDRLMGVDSGLRSIDPTVQDPLAFAMETHLESFLIENWAQTDLSREYNIYEEEGECVGRQYPTDTGPIDILAISKDKRTLLVLELKKGRASDVVVGQVLRYMGYVKEELAEDDQSVRGVIIAMEDDQRIRRALAVVPDIDFFRYQVTFRLTKA